MSNPSSSSIEALLNAAQGFVKELSRPFVGRDEEARIIAAAVVSGEHTVLIGEPGTAKSALARRAAELINARFFKYLLTKFTEPDELFGPLDIVALREGKYVRVTRNKLPEAEIAFIDEIFNASSAILNTLLSIMNERVIYDGYSEIKVPLWTLISTSNNVPEEPELQALYDRFLYRHFVKPVSEDKWIQLLNAVWRMEFEPPEPPKPILTMNEVRELNKLIFSVDLSRVKEKLVKIFAVLEDHGIHVTDRRKGKSLKAIAVNSIINGRLEAVEQDIMILSSVIPRDRDELEQVNVVLVDELKTPEKYLMELAEIENNLRDAKEFIVSMSGFEPRLIDYLRTFEALRERVRAIADSTSNDIVRKKAIDVLNNASEVIALLRRRIGL
ncbi:MAG: AAA family ATPase [Desulfurococcaceae archaeon]|nr:MoxR family ATPase [Sulfolobales archaeon]MDW8170716.1 AAA family ATPase [Desulfurococcaceae archaeon]